MIYWIFDMDQTLYNCNNRPFNYNLLKKDNELINLINKLNGRKILFTNASHIHTNIVLKILGLTSSFDLIVDRDTLGSLKPDLLAFAKLIQWCSITENDTCYFFEDTISNLIMGSLLGWQSVLISPNEENSLNKPLDITLYDKTNNMPVRKRILLNYTFKNIKTALTHFHSRMV